MTGGTVGPQAQPARDGATAGPPASGPACAAPGAASMRLACALLAAALCAGAAMPASAQSLPPGVRIGMEADRLRVVVPDLTRVARPARLSGGLVGVWRGDVVDLAGQRFEPTFFVAGGQLRRVEYAAVTTAADDHGAAAFAALLDWGRRAWGGERLARDTGGLQTSEMASWTVGDDLDVYLQLAQAPRQASVRLVYKLRQVKDASEL